jgi:hypothetical protein
MNNSRWLVQNNECTYSYTLTFGILVKFCSRHNPGGGKRNRGLPWSRISLMSDSKLWLLHPQYCGGWGHLCFVSLRGLLDPGGILGMFWAYPCTCIWYMYQGRQDRVRTWSSTWFPLQTWYSLLLRYQEVLLITVTRGCAFCQMKVGDPSNSRRFSGFRPGNIHIV